MAFKIQDEAEKQVMVICKEKRNYTNMEKPRDRRCFTDIA